MKADIRSGGSPVLRPNAADERQPTGETPDIASKACAVGRPLHWVVRRCHDRGEQDDRIGMHVSIRDLEHLEAAQIKIVQVEGGW
jgi:hypothetical protein